MKWGPFGSNRPSGSRPAMERFVAGSVESVDVMTSEVASVASEYTRRAVELESGFLEAMESQGDALQLRSARGTVLASVLQAASTSNAALQTNRWLVPCRECEDGSRGEVGSRGDVGPVRVVGVIAERHV